MSRSYSFVVLGEAEPAGSKKAFVPLHPKTKQPYRRPGGGIVVSVVDANPHSKGWKKRVAKIAHDECGAPLLTGPLKVTLVFYRERPQSHFGVSGLNKSGREAPFPITKPDAGKLARGTIDAMTGVMYVDDAQIVEEIAIKRYGTPPRAEITVEEVTTPEAENQNSLFAGLDLPAPWETKGTAADPQKASDGRPGLVSAAGKSDDRCDGGTSHSDQSGEPTEPAEWSGKYSAISKPANGPSRPRISPRCATFTA
jgi:Holliday junction resolvase RusA-like endonuclease